MFRSNTTQTDGLLNKAINKHVTKVRTDQFLLTVLEAADMSHVSQLHHGSLTVFTCASVSHQDAYLFGEKSLAIRNMKNMATLNTWYCGNKHSTMDSMAKQS